MNNDNHSNQMNPNNSTYWTSRGNQERPSDWSSPQSDGYSYTSKDLDNKSNQRNPNNSTYYSSRGQTKP